jgi:hypothetical protein
MKTQLIPTILAVISSQAAAAVIYIDLESLTIPFTFEGIYINIVTGDTSFNEPSTFNTAPWINLSEGGAVIANSELLRPWASSASYDAGTDYFINLSPGTTIDSSGLFVSGETASNRHLGLAGNQFQSGEQGNLAFEYTLMGGDVAYGWLSFTPNDSGDGISLALAYTDTPGEVLTVGAIPEPASFAVIAGFIGLALTVFRRRRS